MELAQTTTVKLFFSLSIKSQVQLIGHLKNFMYQVFVSGNVHRKISTEYSDPFFFSGAKKFKEQQFGVFLAMNCTA